MCLPKRFIDPLSDEMLTITMIWHTIRLFQIVMRPVWLQLVPIGPNAAQTRSSNWNSSGLWVAYGSNKSIIPETDFIVELR